MFRIFRKVANAPCVPATEIMSVGFLSKLPSSTQILISSVNGFNGISCRGRLLSSFSVLTQQKQADFSLKSGVVSGGILKSVCVTLDASPSHLCFSQLRRTYFTKEGRVGWRRKRKMASDRREKILEPSSPVIDYKFPWPRDETEGLPKELFGEEIEVLSHEEEMKAKNAVVERINEQIKGHSEGRLFAVVHVNGKQFKVTPEDIIVVQNYFPPNNGDQIRFHKVLLVGGKDFTLIGRPLIDSELVRVEATVIEKTLSYTKLNFKMVKKEDYRRLNFLKTQYTSLRINLIEMMQPLETIKPEFENVGAAPWEKRTLP